MLSSQAMSQALPADSEAIGVASPPANRPAAPWPADPLRPFDRDTFKRGVHWLFEDDPASDVLWVSFSAAAVKPGSFNLYKSLRGLPGKRLFVGDPESQYYQKHIADISQLIQGIARSHGAARAIYWGSSMGAYAAVLFGALDLIPSRVHAFAPQLCLTRPNTHAAHYMRDAGHLDPQFKDIRPLLARRGLHGIGAFIPCYHAWDGPQVEDMLQLGAPGAGQSRLIGTSHRVLEDIAKQQGREVIVEYLTAALHGDALEVPAELQPSDLDISLGIRSYQCVEHVAGRAPRPDLDIDDRASRNHGWFNAKLRVLQSEGRFPEAIAAGLRSLELFPDKEEYLVCLANAYSASSFSYAPALAEGVLRHALRRHPRAPHLRRMLAENLRRRGLVAEAAQVEQPA